MYKNFTPDHFIFISNSIVRVIDYIRSLGWAEELEKIPSGVIKPENDLTINKFCQKELTQRRTF